MPRSPTMAAKPCSSAHSLGALQIPCAAETLVPMSQVQPQTAQPSRKNDDTLKEYFYPETRFGGYTDVDGSVAFYGRVNALLRSEHVVVDVGCGRGEHFHDSVPVSRNLRTLKGKCRHVIGIDVDPNALSNPFLDEFHLIEGTDFPVADATADLCVSDYVVEHVADPVKFVAECNRILKPGGYLCIRTTNAFSYLGLASFLTPNRLHSLIVPWAQRGRNSRDVFPTQYRANTRRRLARTLERAGFDACVYAFDPEPGYLAWSRPAYFLGVLHQRYAPRALGLALFAFAQKR
jgi:SAM-dependent methyltransferase